MTSHRVRVSVRALLAASAGVAMLLQGRPLVAQTEPNLSAKLSRFRIDHMMFTEQSAEFADQCITQDKLYLLRKLLHFDITTTNNGNATFAVGVPPPMFQSDATFTWSSHGHHHVRGFNVYDLVNIATRASVAGMKQAFCVTDFIKYDPNAGPAFYSCTNQGLSPGWSDIYWGSESTWNDTIYDPLPCQFIDITDGVPNGTYVLVGRTNALQIRPEADPFDNGAAVHLTISGNNVYTGAGQGPQISAGLQIVPPNPSGVVLGTASSYSTNRHDYFYRDPVSGGLMYKWQDAKTGVWSPAGAGQNLGGANIYGAPAVASWSPERLDVFAETTTIQLGHWWSSSPGWWSFETLSGQPGPAGDPAVVSPGAGKLMIVYVDVDEIIRYHWFSNAAGWSNGSLPSSGWATEAPALAASGSGKIHLLVRTTVGDIYAADFTEGVGWSGFSHTYGWTYHPISAASWNINRVDAVVRGTDDRLYRNVWNGNGWIGWSFDGLGGLVNAPFILATAPDRLDVFAHTLLPPSMTCVFTRRWNGSNWGSWLGFGCGNNENLVNSFATSFGDEHWAMYRAYSNGSVSMYQRW
jgi:lysyl oxidase